MDPKVSELIRSFAPDALELESRRLPGWARSTLYAILGFLIVAVAWASLSEIDRIVVGKSKVVTSVPPLIIQPFEKSVLASIDARPGQIVRAGATLATLDATFAGSDVADLKTQVASFDAQLRRLNAELSGGQFKPIPGETQDSHTDLQGPIADLRRLEFISRKAALARAISKTEAALSTNRQTQAGLRQELSVVREIEGMRNEAAQKEFGSKLNALQAKEASIQLVNQINQKQLEELEIREQLELQKSDRDSFLAEWGRKTLEEYVTVKRQRDTAQQQLLKAERRSSLVVLTAPRDAIVLDVVRRGAGSVTSEGEVLMSLVPLDAPLEIEAEVELRDVGSIRIGDPVRLKFDAFPFQRHGTVEGAVRTISEDSLPAADRTDKLQIYRVRISLPPNGLDAVPADFRFVPGMSGQAEIKIGRRRVIAYLLYPIVRALDEGLREP